MSDVEFTKGPYLKWLQGVRRQLGERVWDHLQDLSGPVADDLLESHGVIPFVYSPERWQQVMAWLDGRATVDTQTAPWGDDGPPLKSREHNRRDPSGDPGFLASGRNPEDS